MSGQLVVVGASLAGLRAVEAARKAGFDGAITLIGAETHLPYDRPPLSKRYLLGEVDADVYRTEDALREELGVELRLGERAIALRAEDRVVVTDRDEYRYDSLIIATGAAPRTIPGVPDLAGIVTLRSIGDADRLRELVVPGARVVILGAGFIGSEIASSAKKLGAHATVLDGAPVPLVRAVGEEIGGALASLHPANGTRLILGTVIEEFVGDDAIREVRLSNGEVLPADVVVIGIGAAPATGWLRDSGIDLDARDGGVVCDEHMQTSLPGVFAAGDVAHWPNRALGLTMRLENWTNAADQAAVAGRNAVTPDSLAPYATVPYFWSDWYEQRIQFVGTATADSVEIVAGSVDDTRFVALFVTDDRVVGAATLNEPRKIMKLRRVIADGAGREAALEIVNGAARARTPEGATA
ncbi:NAD(P)/FAD-dependent oxidoreductase [Microbacterium thalassium]|uniref:NADPH-dependent 2,4-dienoyl-CoA reductase/sulfur reductase-like enzyme n=1 Tax=Microbacterium thalassium TaxID=362649 RepID=A0A7X0FN10_9MICO|nr:FAD-dependent oxidoreductase [Microbacterium thalassium]MBB6390504.1 NADPH-dependent 2,4-dienoyl-CoA reductase/sulfur reductase-like enzyme [Microbacterium thalassium]GLK25615.1 pyridine nucleotide-disulfide oxidoreductase [Microbacterium thalassium]